MNYNNFNNHNFFQPTSIPFPIQTQTIRDEGPNPYVVSTEAIAKMNNNYRQSVWTGKHLQATVMSIGIGDDIGLEVHPNTDQLLLIEDGQGITTMGPTKESLNYQQCVNPGDAVFVPAGVWHNIVNNSNRPLKIFTIYAPPHHPFGTVHQTKAIAEQQESPY